MSSEFTVRSLGLATIGYALGSALARIATLLLLPVYTAFLSAAEIGVVATLQIFSTMMTPIVTVGIGSALGVCYFSYATDQERDRVVGNANGVIVIAAALFVLIGSLTHEAIGALIFRDATHGYPVLLALLSVAVGALSTPLALRLQFRRSVTGYIIVSLLGAVFALLLGIVLVAVADRGVAGAMEAQLLSQLVGLGGFIAVSRNAIAIRVDLAITRELIRVGLTFIPSFLFLLVLQQGGQYLLMHLHGLQALGTYSVAYSLGLALSVAVAAFTAAWMPHFHSYANRHEVAREELGRPMMWFVVGFGALATLAFVWSRPALCVFVAESFAVNPLILGLTATAQVLIGTFTIFLPPLYFARKAWVGTVIQGVGALSSLAIAWGMILAWEDEGAAAAHGIGMLVTSGLLLTWIRRAPGRYLQVAYPWSRIVLATATYATVAGLVSVGRSLPCSIEWAISVLATIVTAVAALWLLPANERQTVRGIAASAVTRLRVR